MACPYFRLSGGDHPLCCAIQAEVVPSSEERERQCKTSWRYARCKWYRQARALARPLSDGEYSAALFGDAELTQTG